MNDSVLVNVLNEILEEQKNLTKEIQFLTKAIEVNNEEVVSFQKTLMGIKIEVPLQCFKPYEELIKYGINKIREIVANQPKEVLHEKRILFYPEGNRENFLKFLFTRTMWTVCIIGIVWIIIKVGAPYYTKNSENGRYKAAYLWLYVNSSSKGQDYMYNQYDEMKNDSIREKRLTEIDNYLKKYSK